MKYKKDQTNNSSILSDILKRPVILDYFNVDNENNKNKLWRLFQLYNGKRVKDNYSKESFDNLLRENRFSHGVICLKFNDNDIIFFCGLSLYREWLVITRYVTFYPFKSIPFASAIMIPYLIKKCQSENIKGIVYTFNDYLKIVYDFYRDQENNSINITKFNRYKILLSNPEYTDHYIFNKAFEIDNLYKTLDYPVNYKNTKQWVVYISTCNEKPQFDIYHEN